MAAGSFNLSTLKSARAAAPAPAIAAAIPPTRVTFSDVETIGIAAASAASLVSLSPFESPAEPLFRIPKASKIVVKNNDRPLPRSSGPDIRLPLE